MSDEQGATSSADVKFIVKGVGAKPCPLKVEDDCLFIAQDKTVTIDVLANDKGTDLRIVEVSELDGGEVQIVDGKLKVKYTSPSYTSDDILMADEDTGFMMSTASEPFLGTDTFTYTVEDAFGERATAEVTPHIIANSDHRDDYKGTTKSDFVIAGKGNDYLAGGEGNDQYFFSKGDGHDTIMDSSGDDDRIVFTPSMKDGKESLRFLLEKDGDLVVSYGKEQEDSITVKYAEEGGKKRDTIGVEKIEMDNGTYLDSNDIDKIIQILSSHRGSETDINTMNGYDKENDIGKIYWHQG
jgi:Ca2+-binding RTX toxin-like protein